MNANEERASDVNPAEWIKPLTGWEGVIFELEDVEEEPASG
jgi:hypothetical protein